MSGKRPSSISETKLGEWLHAATKSEKLTLAYRCGVDVGYLQLLAGVHRENPGIRLAIAIVEGIKFVNHLRKINQQLKLPLPEVSLIDLAEPTRREEDGWSEIKKLIAENEQYAGVDLLCKD